MNSWRWSPAWRHALWHPQRMRWLILQIWYVCCCLHLICRTSWPQSQIQKGINGACVDDTKGVKCTIIDWITPKGQSLTPHIPQNGKAGRGFNHECTRALFCPAGLDWNNSKCVSYLIWFDLILANCDFQGRDPSWWMAKFRLRVTSGPFFCTQITCMIQRIPGMGYFGAAFLFQFILPCILLFFNHQDRHTNTSLHLLALWSKNRRQHAPETHGFMECGMLLRRPSCTSRPRYALFLFLTFSY